MRKNFNEKKEKNNKEEMKGNKENQNLELDEIKNNPTIESESITDSTVDDRDIRINELEKEISELKDRFLRKAAEFENYKRRTEIDQLNLLKYSAESFIIKLLPVIDDLERSLQHIDSAKNNESLKEGINLVYDKFMKVLEDQGVHKIDCIGKPFDVHYHEALMQKKTDEAEPHTVIEEIQAGYMYKDKVIRHSKVVVSDSPEESVEVNNKDKENNNTPDGKN